MSGVFWDSSDPQGAPEVRPLALWTLTLDGRVQCANAAAAEVQGHSGAPRPWRDCWPEERRFLADRALGAAQGGETSTFRSHIAWGERGRAHVETTLTPVSGADGTVMAVAVCMRDITAEWDRAAFLNSVIDLLPMSLTVRDLASGRYVLANPFAEDLFGRDPDDVVGHTVEDLFPARAGVILALDAEAIRAGRTKVTVATEARDAQGRVRKMCSTRVTTYDDTGPRYLINLAEETTEAEAAADTLRNALREAERANRAKDAFLANISHEIRTPLHGVIASADMLAQLDPPEAARELIELVRASSLALQVKLQTVLELVDLDQDRVALHPEPFEVADLLDAAAAIATPPARAKGLQVRVHAGGLAGARYHGDVQRIRQILDQLLDNAVKFTEAGRLDLRATATPTGLRFVVEDTGIGVDADAAPRLFDRFRQADDSLTRAHGGFGLGLALASELVELMGGRIGCEPRIGGGARFWFEAPLEHQAAPAATLASWESKPQILVVDDHPTNRRLVELVLGDLATVRTANDGREAVEAASAQAFDLILMDIQMPVLDGVSAVAEIRRQESAHRRPRTPIAMLTANTDADNLAASHAAGADRHIAKPFTAGLLIHSVREMLTAAPDTGFQARISFGI
jgi:PAS domain S-box-containing protein